MTYFVLKAPLNVLTIIYRKLPKATTVAFSIYHWRQTIYKKKKKKKKGDEGSHVTKMVIHFTVSTDSTNVIETRTNAKFHAIHNRRWINNFIAR